jgi:hypothetical protein
MAALVTAYPYGLCVFLDGGNCNLCDRSVVAEMDHLRAGGLKDSSHYVDSRVMSIEEGGSGDDSDVMFGLV